MSLKRLYGKFTKVEEQADGTLLVEGVASSEAVDSQGEVIKASAMAAALPDYMKFPTIREMHQAWAAGKTTAAAVDEQGVTHIVTKVVDAEAVRKVKEGVYAGFSIGGTVPPGGRSKDNPKIIEQIRLTEISLVDRPANPDAVITVFKAEVAPAIPIIFGSVKVSAEIFEKVAGKSAQAILDELVKATNVEVKKGMYAVQWAADLCQSLSNLAADTQWEADFEGDNSAIPGRIKAMCAELCAILRDLVAEETAELVGADVAEADAVTMVNKPGALKKSERVAGLARAVIAAAKGEDLGKAAELSAKVDELQKAAADATQKVADTTAKLAEATAKLAEFEKRATDAETATAAAGEALKKVVAERDQLKAEVATKGWLKIVPVEKKSDGQLAAEADFEKLDPVEQTKLIHASGGRRVI